SALSNSAGDAPGAGGDNGLTIGWESNNPTALKVAHCTTILRISSSEIGGMLKDRELHVFHDLIDGGELQSRLVGEQVSRDLALGLHGTFFVQAIRALLLFASLPGQMQH